MNVTPVRPQPKPVTLEAKKTALIVLDQNQQVEEPGSHGHSLIPALTRLLAKAREAGLYIIFTVPLVLRGTPHEQVYSGYKRDAAEPLIYPDGYDKFIGGQLESLLKKPSVDTLIFAGSRSNLCVMYTATRAARNFKFNVVIPVDGHAAESKYEEEYTMHQFATFPGGVGERFSFTSIDEIKFK